MVFSNCSSNQNGARNMGWRRLFRSIGYGALAIAWMVFWGGQGQAASLFDRADRKPVPLVAVSLQTNPDEEDLAVSAEDAQASRSQGLDGGSLFTGRQGGSLFAPVAPRVRASPRLHGGIKSYMMPLTLPQVVLLRSLIASVEAGPAQYDAVVFSARIKPPKRPTDMTLQEIFDWIDETPEQNHAIGRYQFIPNTLRSVMEKVGAPAEARFTPALQDRLADVLLHEAGLPEFMNGTMPQMKFMNNLARIWAGLPNSSGKSHYEGIAGNKAGMSWGRFTTAMSQIFPDAQKADQKAES